MTDPGGLQINDHDDRIELSGDIDASTVGDLTSRLDAAEGDIVLDLSGVEFIDSSGIRALVGAKQQADERGDSMAIVDPSRAVRRLFELSSLDTYFDVR